MNNILLKQYKTLCLIDNIFQNNSFIIRRNYLENSDYVKLSIIVIGKLHSVIFGLQKVFGITNFDIYWKDILKDNLLNEQCRLIQKLFSILEFKNIPENCEKVFIMESCEKKKMLLTYNLFVLNKIYSRLQYHFNTCK